MSKDIIALYKCMVYLANLQKKKVFGLILRDPNFL